MYGCLLFLIPYLDLYLQKKTIEFVIDIFLICTKKILNRLQLMKILLFMEITSTGIKTVLEKELRLILDLSGKTMTGN